ncbi:MAG: hypothetical protein U5K37_02525 [Natrialbaceae archaeon]|nr:hypothetical protein [Natrialbaceae archaeon]
MVSLPPIPRSRADARLVLRTVRLVLGQPGYAITGLITSALTLVALAISLNVALIMDVVIGGGLSLGQRLEIVALQLPFVGPAFTPVQGGLVLIISGLTGINLTLLVYHTREHGLSASGGSGSAAGVIVGVLGAGCAACGPVVLAGILSLVGAAGIFTLLPWEGLEIATLSIVLLVLSMYWLADGMRGGMIRGCPVDVTRRS